MYIEAYIYTSSSLTFIIICYCFFIFICVCIGAVLAQLWSVSCDRLLCRHSPIRGPLTISCFIQITLTVCLLRSPQKIAELSSIHYIWNQIGNYISFDPCKSLNEKSWGARVRCVDWGRLDLCKLYTQTVFSADKNSPRRRVRSCRPVYVGQPGSGVVRWWCRGGCVLRLRR